MFPYRLVRIVGFKPTFGPRFSGAYMQLTTVVMRSFEL